MLVTTGEQDIVRFCYLMNVSFSDADMSFAAGGQRWSGSVAEIGSVNGKVKLSFVDEVDPVTSSSLDGGGSFLRRLFAAF